MKIIQKIAHRIHLFLIAYLEKRGYFIKPIWKKDASEIVIENFFKTKYDKNVLISYIVYPFSGTISNTHTNHAECYTIANTFSELGYNVDIVQWDNTEFVPQKKYDVLFDNHNAIERYNKYLDAKCLKILHISNCYWLYQNYAEYHRLYELLNRKSKSIPPKRTLTPSRSIELCDFATCLGNDFTISTYQFANKPIFRIPVSCSKKFELNPNKDYNLCKKNFLWIGSTGFVLKGLDLVIEAFVEMPDYQLTICCPIHSESEFEQTFYTELYQSPNIHTKGWIDIESAEFQTIIDDSISIISTSFSEGGGASAIQGMHGGLIPIVSCENSVDIEDFGIVLPENTIEEIKKAVMNVSSLPLEVLKQKCEKSWTFARKHHTLENFSTKFRAVLENNL